MLTWIVKNFDCNKQAIIDYNALKPFESFIRKQKKKCSTKEEFSEELRKELKYRYWSRSEYELVLVKQSGRIILMPWVGCRDAQLAAIDVTGDKTFDWDTFSLYHLGRLPYTSRAKIDIWDQLVWRWDELVDYCWYTRLPYERKHSKFEL